MNRKSFEKSNKLIHLICPCNLIKRKCGIKWPESFENLYLCFNKSVVQMHQMVISDCEYADKNPLFVAQGMLLNIDWWQFTKEKKSIVKHGMAEGFQHHHWQCHNCRLLRHHQDEPYQWRRRLRVSYAALIRWRPSTTYGNSHDCNAIHSACYLWNWFLG